MQPVNPKNFIINNLAYRMNIYHPDALIHIGAGHTNASVLVIQPHIKMPERDAITGALKNFGMLNNAYRATIEIIEKESLSLRRYYLKELIEIIDPLVVVACGTDVISILRNKKIRSFKKYAGKTFQVSDLNKPIFYGVLNPTDYGFHQASLILKTQGKKEWAGLANLYQELKTEQEKLHWAC